MTTRQGCNRKIASRFAQELVKLVGRRRTDRLILVGCENIELLIELVHRGFVDVTCCTALAGPNAGEMSGDAIIVPTFDRERQSAVALSRIDRSLRSNGILVIGTASGGVTPHTRQIPALLIQHGFSLVRSRIEPVGPDILCCRKLPILHAQAA